MPRSYRNGAPFRRVHERKVPHRFALPPPPELDVDAQFETLAEYAKLHGLDPVKVCEEFLDSSNTHPELFRLTVRWLSEFPSSRVQDVTAQASDDGLLEFVAAMRDKLTEQGRPSTYMAIIDTKEFRQRFGDIEEAALRKRIERARKTYP